MDIGEIVLKICAPFLEYVAPIMPGDTFSKFFFEMEIGQQALLASIMVTFVSPSIVEVSSTLLFFVGVCGVAMNRRSVLLVLMSVELMLLAVNIKLIASSV